MMMRFAARPHINWGPRPSPRTHRNWCGLCRRPSGPLFDVPDATWLHYVGEEQRHQIVCIGCWHWLTDVVDARAFEQEHGGAVPLWSPEFRRRHGISADTPTPPMPPWMTITDAQSHPTSHRRQDGTAGAESSP